MPSPKIKLMALNSIALIKLLRFGPYDPIARAEIPRLTLREIGKLLGITAT